MLIKTKKETELIREGGKLMGEVLQKLALSVHSGMSTAEVDRMAEQMIVASGGRPAFKGYRAGGTDIPFPGTICASLNEEVVHGIPRTKTKLKDGDIFTIDIGMEYPVSHTTVKKRGYFTDTALTLAVGEVSDEVKKLLAVTREALEVGIKAARPGESVASIGKAIEYYVRSEGKYGIVRDLVGHGVGHAVHEDPHVPNYYDKSLEKIMLQPGMVIAIEPMISLSNEWRVRTRSDGWTIEMADGALSAHFEHTIIITKTGNVVATRRPHEDRECWW